MNATEPQHGFAGRASMSSTPPLENAAPGQLVGRRYLVGSTIAHGPSGLICRAKTIDDERPLSIRFMRSSMNDERSRNRFQQTMRAATELKSDHIAHVIGAGSLATGVQYLVSEYFDGVSLADRLAKFGPLPAAQAAGFARQICEALTEAHAAGIVHRDIKPSNLFLTNVNGEELLKVLDFGTPKKLVLRRGDPTTRAADGVASPHYASPEQIATPAIIDGRSDLWAVGIVLHEMLTGRRPFDGDSAPEIFAKVLGERPASIRALRPELDRGLEAVVLRCLAKDPAQRFQSATALSRALEPFEHDATGVPRAEWSFSAGPVELPLDSRRSFWIGLTLVVALVVGLIVIGLLGSRAVSRSHGAKLNREEPTEPAPVGERVLETDLPQGAYGVTAMGFLRAEPELGTRAHRFAAVAAVAAKHPINLDQVPDRAREYQEFLKQNGMRSPADVYILERRIFDSKGNLLDVQTRVLEGPVPPPAPKGTEETQPAPVPTATASAQEAAPPSNLPASPAPAPTIPK